MELYEKSCAVCVRRPRENGGNNSCPLIELSRRRFASMTSHECPSFKLGDLKPVKGAIQRGLEIKTEPLF